MAQETSILGQVCPALLTALSALNGANDPSMKQTPVGITQLLMDPENRKPGSIVPVDSGDGHLKQVRVKYITRGTEDDVADSASICTPGTEVTRLEQTFTVDMYSNLKLEFPESTIRTLCSGASDWLAVPETDRGTDSGARKAFMQMRDSLLTIFAKLDGFRQANERKIATAIMANVGAFSASQAVVPTAPYALSMIKLTDGDKVLKGINEWQQQVTLAQIYGKPLIAGLGNFNRWNNAMKYGCCNAGGTDFGKMSDAALYKYYMSRMVDDVFGQDNFLTFAPESTQLVTYLENRGTFGQQLGTLERGLMTDPAIPGLTYDVNVLPNECNKSYTFDVGLNFGVWFQPLDAYASGDPLENTNGILLFKANAV